MKVKNNLPYIKYCSSEQFQFYMVPQQLLTDSRFVGLSHSAILLYSMLLDRTGLSRKNQWWDDKGNIYIMYTRQEAMDRLKISKPTCSKIFQELCTYGLIEEIQRGVTKVNIIYVKQFVNEDEIAPEKLPLEELEEMDYLSPESSNSIRGKETLPHEVKNFNLTELNNFTSRSKEILPHEVKNFNLTELNNFTSKGKEVLPLEVKNFIPNNTNIYNTNNINYTEQNKTENYKTQSIHPSYDRIGDNEEDEFKQGFLAAIEFDIIKDDPLGNIIEDISNTVLSVAGLNEVRISNQNIPIKEFKEKMINLNATHMIYAAECLSKAKNVRNPRAYILATLWNAQSTMNTYYTTAVNNL